MAKIGELVINLTAGTGQFKTDITNAARHTESAVGRMSSSIKGFAGLLGVGLSASAFAGMIKGSIDAGDRLYDLSLRTQTSVASLASLKLISEQSGTDLDALGKGLNKLSVFMAENSDAAKKLGITAKDPAQAFIQFTKALEGAATPQDRAAIANKVMGKSYQELLPLMSEGSEKLREAVLASAGYADQMENFASRADMFNDRLNVMANRWDAAKVSMATFFMDLLPNSMSMDATSARMLELRDNITKLERTLGKGEAGRGRLGKWLFGSTEDFTAELAAAKAELATLAASKLKSPTKPSGGLVIGDLDDTKKITDQVEDARLQHLTTMFNLSIAARDEENEARIQGMVVALNITTAANDELIAEEKIAQDALTQIYVDGFNERQRVIKRADWWGGAKEAMRDYAESANDDFAQMSSFATSSMRTVEDAMVEAAMTGQISFQNMANAIIADLVRIAAQKAIAGVVTNLVMGGAGAGTPGAPSFVGPPAPFAKGGVFDGAAGLSAFSGSIVNKPTPFMFAAGAGIMGEAGPEAIMPLKRGADGKLGVAGGGRSVTVNNVFTLSQPADKRTQEQVASMAGASIQRALARSA